MQSMNVEVGNAGNGRMCLCVRMTKRDVVEISREFLRIHKARVYPGRTRQTLSLIGDVRGLTEGGSRVSPITLFQGAIEPRSRPGWRPTSEPRSCGEFEELSICPHSTSHTHVAQRSFNQL